MEELIEVNPKVMVGKPVIRGTRITVEQILEKLAAGRTTKEILASYPHIDERQVLACLEYARRSLSTDFVFPFENQAARRSWRTRTSKAR
jgi:uncharacterized protein (DUF433 family)